MHAHGDTLILVKFNGTSLVQQLAAGEMEVRSESDPIRRSLTAE